MIRLRFFNVFVIFIFLIGFFSCSSQQERQAVAPGGGERIIVDASEVEKESDMSDLIEEIKLFPLEEVEGSMLGDVQKVLLTDKHLVVFDQMETKKIVVFDRGGKFVKDLEIVGDGPDKLTQITDCWLNNQGNLEVYDKNPRKILVFDESFELEKAIRAKDPDTFNYMMNIPGSNEYVAYTGYSSLDREPYKMAFLDHQLAVKDKILPFDTALVQTMISTPLNPFLRIGDSLRFYQTYDPHIYTVRPERGLAIRYQLDYIYRPLSLDFEKELIMENLPVFTDWESSYEERKAVFKGYSGFGGFWQESRDYAIFISFDTGHDQFTSVYHKGKKEIIAQSKWFREDQRYKLAIPSYFFAAEAESNRFVTVIPAFLLAEYYIAPDSPFYPTVLQDPETLFVLEMELK